MRRLFLVLSLVLPVALLVGNAAWAGELAATIFSYDGTGFVRTQTTLTRDGQSAVNTKLDHDSPVLQSVVAKTVLYWGRDYYGPSL